MFGIGFGEFLLIIIIALIFIGPEKLPEVAKAAAKFYNELRRAGGEIKRSVREIEIEPSRKPPGEKPGDHPPRSEEPPPEKAG